MRYEFPEHLFKNKSIKRRLTGLKKNDIEDFFLSHNSPNSIKAIKDFFLSIGVKSTGYKLPQERVKEIPLPFIAQLNNPEEFVVIDDFNNSKFIITSSKETRKKYSGKSFYSRWSGVVLTLDLETKLSPSTRWLNKHLFVDKTDTIIILLLLLTIPFPLLRTLKDYDFLSLTVLGLIVIGLYSSFTLMRLEYGKQGNFEKKICYANSKFNCKEVVNSKVSHLWGSISLASLGFFFFSALYILILSHFLITKDANTIISFICLLISPFSMILILYQIFNVKKICPFCTLTQLSILICGIIYLAKPYSPLHVASYEFLISSLFSILSALCFTLTLTVYYSSEKFKKEVLLLHSLKHNWTVVKGLLEKEQELLPDKENIIFKSRVGNPEVVFALSLNCGHCHSAFLEYKHILDTMPKIGLGLVFIVHIDNVKKVGGFIQKIEDIYRNNDSSWLDMVDKWFSDSEFRKQNSNKHYDEAKLENYVRWSFNNAITISPTLTFNGRIWPRELSTSDLSDYLRSKF